jgi:hypothetical protein
MPALSSYWVGIVLVPEIVRERVIEWPEPFPLTGLAWATVPE